MAIEKILVLIFVLTVNVQEMAGKSFNANEMTEDANQLLDENIAEIDNDLAMMNSNKDEKRAIIGAVYGVISEVIGLASTIQGTVCEFTDVCSTDEINPKLDALDGKLDKLEVDVKAIRKDVEEIWEKAKRKWYFEHIEYMISERKKIIADLKVNDISALAKDRRNRYIDEVLGSSGKDVYVQKALFQIPGLVTNEGLVDHYFNTKVGGGMSKKNAAKSTWQFIKKLFRYQEDGYANIVFAASLKYKADVNSFNKIVSEVCTMWNKPNSPKYQAACQKFGKDPNSANEREKQLKYIFNYRDLFLYPILEVKKDCDNFKDSNEVVYNDGFLYVAQPAAGKILVVKPDTLETATTIDIPGTQCGGKCHPFGIAIDGQHNVLGISAHNQAEGGDSFVMMYKINGNLKAPASGLTIQHYYTMRQLQKPTGKKADVRSAAFCGGRFGYADYNGVVYLWRMNYGSDQPEPRLRERNEWAVERASNLLEGNIEYLHCSNDGKRWVAACNSRRESHEGSGGVPSGNIRNTDNLLSLADIKATKDDWKDLFAKDHHTRLNIVKGAAIDSKGNLFYSGQQWQGDGVSGLYERRHDGERRFVREWETTKPAKVKIFGVAADDNGFLFAVQQESSLGKCLHRYNINMEVENLNV